MEANPVRRMFARGGRPKPAKDPPEPTFIDALALQARPNLCHERGWTLEEVEIHRRASCPATGRRVGRPSRFFEHAARQRLKARPRRRGSHPSVEDNAWARAEQAKLN
jgi:hypothetical protein